MTIKECIDIVDNSKPNQYGTKEKVIWLSFLDEIIINDVLKTHEGYDRKYDNFEGYTEDRISIPLIVPSPYDRMYTAYLTMKIDEKNGETARYNTSASMFNSYLMEYRKYYHKTHMPLSKGEQGKYMPKTNEHAINDAMYEKLKKELYFMLSNSISEVISDNKLYDIVMSYVNNNVQMLRGLDGKDYVLTKEDKEEIASIVKAEPSRIDYVKLKSSAWITEENNLHYQVVAIDGITENSQVNLTPAAEQLTIFHEKDIGFVAENIGGVVKVYAIGQKPTNDYTIQVTITEVKR